MALHSPPPIYLDFAATTPLDPRALAIMTDCYRIVCGNSSSQHQAGRAARRRCDEAVDQLGRLLGARVDRIPPDRVILTSGGTEANNLVLRGWLAADEVTTASDNRAPALGRDAARLIVSAIEHPSVLATATQLELAGWQVDRLRVTSAGAVDLADLDRLLAHSGPPPRLVSVMLANNETGVVQPVAEIVSRCAAAGVPVHTDAVQAVGKISVDFAGLGVAALTLAAHKLHGPVGVGALIIRGGHQVQPVLWGGAQQLGTRPGTESVALAAGFAGVLAPRVATPSTTTAALARRRDRLEHALVEQCGAVVNGTGPRVPHISNLSFLGVDRQALLMALDFAGICCSSGAACASGSSEPSHVLRAMQLSNERVVSAVRFSVGETTTEAEIDEAILRIVSTVERLRRPRESSYV